MADERLVEATIAGDSTGFDQLVLRYGQVIHNLAFRMCGNYHLAQDLTQQVFIAVFLSLRSYRGESRFFCWMYGIALNVIHDQIRKAVNEKSREWLITVGSLDNIHCASTDHFDTLHLELVIDKALHALAPGESAAVRMYHMQNLSYNQIANVMGVPLGTVKSLIHRGRKKMQELLVTEGLGK